MSPRGKWIETEDSHGPLKGATFALLRQYQAFGNVSKAPDTLAKSPDLN